MAGLDTNILVRWLVDDDAAQSRRIAERLRLAARREETLFVPMTVMLELEWVLRSRYAFAKPDVLLAMNALLETRELEFQPSPPSNARCTPTGRAKWILRTTCMLPRAGPTNKHTC